MSCQRINRAKLLPHSAWSQNNPPAKCVLQCLALGCHREVPQGRYPSQSFVRQCRERFFDTIASAKRQQLHNMYAAYVQHTCSRLPPALQPLTASHGSPTRSKKAHTSWPGVSLSWRACCSLLWAQICKGGRESDKLDMRSRINFQLNTLPWPGNRALEGPGVAVTQDCGVRRNNGVSGVAARSATAPIMIRSGA